MNEGIKIGDICWFSKYNHFKPCTQRDLDTDWSSQDYIFRKATPEERKSFVLKERKKQPQKNQKFTIKGTIEFYCGGNYPKILLIHDKSGWKQDLISRLIELGYNSQGGALQVNYHIVDKPMSEIELKELIIKKLVGSISADYSSYETGYSSITCWTEYSTDLRVGGHDLFNELKNSAGKWVYFEVIYKPIRK